MLARIPSSGGFHSSSMLLRRRKDRWRVGPFFVETKGGFTTSDDDEKIITAQSMEFRPIEMMLDEKPREFTKNILERRHANRVYYSVHLGKERETLSTDEEVHEVARQQILSDAETTLSYRQVQKLVKLNQLGKATGKRDVLEKKLLTFFRRMGNLTTMTKWEMVNIRYNLAGDVEEAPCEDERSEYGYAEDKKIIERWGDETFEQTKIEQKNRLMRYFVADLEHHTRKTNASKSKEIQKQRHYDVMGAFYAAPAKTGRARCQICRQAIPKDSLRVSEHVLSKFYTGRKRWSPQQTQQHFCASCFVAKESSSESISENNPGFLFALENAIVKRNEQKEKDKGYQRMLCGAISLTYPANALTFGRELPEEEIIPAVVTEPGYTMAVASGRTENKNKPK